MHQSFDDRAERQGREDHQAGGEGDHADEQDDEGRRRRCGTCPAEAGTIFFFASAPPSASAANIGTKRPSSIAIVPKSALKLVSPKPANALPLLFDCES